MYSRTAALALLFAVAQARFGQEQVPIPAIAAVKGGASGAAATIAGAAISDLLAATNACDKLRRGDQILAELGTGADAVAAAIGIVGAEKNFNPFAQSIPTICSDPTLPVSEVLRGITPLIDPAVDGSAAVNALAAQTKASPLNAAGKSVADLLTENGFSNFISQNSAGATVQPAAGAGAATGGNAAAGTAVTTKAAAAAATTAATGNATNAGSGDCAAAVSSALASAAGNVVAPTTAVAAAAAASTTTAAGTAAATGAATGGATGAGGEDFGLCVPTIKFEGGLGGRPATEFTFLPIDPLVAKGQQEALNPNIITNRICDQLTNVCQANQAAKDLCKSAQAQILALGTRNKGTADTWNTLLGFAGTVTNPDGGAAEPPAKMRVVRSFRA